MLFSEVYGTYYNVLAKLLDRAGDGSLTREDMHRSIREDSFEESILSIPEALDSETWPLTTLQKQILVPELTDERNALERVMLHFSHLDKETERLDTNRYRITLHYEQADETELLIRVLSFGPVLRVISPDDFIKNLRLRLEKQVKLRTQT